MTRWQLSATITQSSSCHLSNLQSLQNTTFPQFRLSGCVKIKILRSGNDGEYEFRKYLEASGIIHQTSIAHTPQQNGLAERMNRTTIEKAKCLLFDVIFGEISLFKIPQSETRMQITRENFERLRCMQTNNDNLEDSLCGRKTHTCILC